MKLLTHDNDIEKTILYSLIWFRSVRKQISKIVEEDFYYDEHKKIFNHLAEYVKADKDFDIHTLKLHAQAKTAIAILDMHVLETLWDEYLAKLKQVSATRKLEMIAYHTKTKILEKKSPAEIRKWLIDTVSEVDDSTGNIISSQQTEIDDEFMAYIETDTKNIIRSGFAKLDREIGGFFAGSFVAIGGLPKTGKTTMMMNMVRSACKQGKRVLLVSLEMGVTDIQAKLVSQITGISTSELRGITHTNDDDSIRRIMHASAEISEYKLYRIGRKGLSVADIENEIKNLGGVDIVFVDYLQKLKARNLTEARHSQIEQMSNDLSMLAISQNIPVVFIAILNREHVHRSDGRPSLSDFRGSGAVEYDVTSALLLHRNEEENVTEMIIAANRYGEGGGSAIKFKFEPEKSRFNEVIELAERNGRYGS